MLNALISVYANNKNHKYTLVPSCVLQTLLDSNRQRITYTKQMPRFAHYQMKNGALSPNGEQHSSRTLLARLFKL
jgi:hypothetical protein